MIGKQNEIVLLVKGNGGIVFRIHDDRIGGNLCRRPITSE